MFRKNRKRLFFLALIACLVVLYYNANYGRLHDWLTLQRLESKLSIQIPPTAQQVFYENNYSDWSREGVIYFVYHLTEQEMEQTLKQRKFQNAWSPAPIPDEIYLDLQHGVANDSLFEISGQPLPFDLQSGYYTIVDKEKRVLNKMSLADYFKYRDYAKQACLGVIDLNSSNVYLLIQYN